ncbi:MAG: ArsR family transcriptional regulator [Spirochaetes bacterium]|nr:ArsR family transcriptional regulator [Spirochaetota bacterium]
MDNKTLVIDAEQDIHILKGLASEIRVKILQLVSDETVSINDISEKLSLPQSTVTTNIQILEQCGLVKTESAKGIKGSRKMCSALFSSFLVNIRKDGSSSSDSVSIEMPVGLFFDYQVSAPCGMCSSTRTIGFLDSPEAFLMPERVSAGLLWLGKGFVKYKFPNNAYNAQRPVSKILLSMELSSEVPGTNPDWKSDIFVKINGKKIGTWTSPGDFGDKRGKFTPEWWKNKGSQYGILTAWEVNSKGTFIDNEKISDVKINDLTINMHHSIEVTVGVDEKSKNVGGMNIFGKDFGNYDQDICLKMFFGE